MVIPSNMILQCCYASRKRIQLKTDSRIFCTWSVLLKYYSTYNKRYKYHTVLDAICLTEACLLAKLYKEKENKTNRDNQSI